MKKFTRIEPTSVQEVGLRFKQQAVVKNFETSDGLRHEFTTLYREGSRAAGVIALTADRQIISLYQFRPGPEEWVYDIPGGGLGVNEDPFDGALRELEEETGYVPGVIELLGTSYSGGYSNLEQYYYFATDCVPGGGGISLDTEENDQGAEVRLLRIAEFIEKSKQGRMSDPAAVLMAYDKLIEMEKR